MIDSIIKYHKSSKTSYQFSVLIPSWNNLPFLKLCIYSIQKNSQKDIQIIVIANEANDGTLEWLENQKEIDYLHAKSNIGICYGLNIARSLVKSDYLVYVNDDMYLLPGWDIGFYNEIEKIGHKKFMLSCTMIEPTETGNPCVIVKNYGQNIESFQEDLLLKEYTRHSKDDWSGSSWPPNILHIDTWDLVGGFSIEFSPGMYSDPDLSMKLFKAGVRIYKGKGNCLVYHFGSKSTKRIKRNKGKKTFLLKWGITPRTFTDLYLKMGKPYSGELEVPVLDGMTSFVNKIKRILSCW